MTYDPTIPKATDIPANSQPQILANFNQANAQFAINHLPFTTTSAQAGFHTDINFAAPLVADPNLAAPQASVYPKAVAGTTQLFFQNGALAANVVQLTNIVPTQVGTNYFIQTPFGLKIAYGFWPNIGSTTHNITFAGTFASTPIICLVTQQDTVGGARAATYNTLTTTTVVIISSNSTSSGSYFVLGV